MPFNIAPAKKQTFDPLPLRRFHVLYLSNPRWLWAAVRALTALQTRTLSSPDYVNLAPVTFAADVRSDALGSIAKRWKHSYGRCDTALLDEDAANGNAGVTYPAWFGHEHVNPEIEEVAGKQNRSL